MARPKNTRTTETPWPYGMRVGSMRDAEKCADGMLRKVGNGFMRDVFVNARGDVVYKVARRGGNVANESEYATMVQMHTDPRYRQHTTPVALYHVKMADGSVLAIVAMVFRPGDSWDATRRQQDLFARRCGNLPDMHGQNWRSTPKGRAKITDIGRVVW